MRQLCQKKHLQETNLPCFLIFIVFTLSACQGVSSFGTPDPEYLKLLDIGPCWNEICPEQTSREDAINKLSSLDTVEPAQLEYIQGRNEIALPFDSERFGTSNLRLEYTDQVISGVTITIGSDGNMSLSQIIDYFGTPDWIIATEVCVGDRAVPDYGFDLWYEENGVSVTTGGFPTRSPASDLVPREDLLIYRIVYDDKIFDSKQWLQTHPGYWRYVTLDEAQKHLYPWLGWKTPLPSYVDGCR